MWGFGLQEKKWRKTMSNSITHVSKWMTTAAIITVFGGTALAGGFILPRNNPNPPAEPQQLTKEETKKLIQTAKSPDDHLTLARYYQAEADKLDAQGAGYEEAAATLRNGPIVRNLMAPNTPARYEYFAKGFREEAKSDRELAASHQQMASNTVAALR
jgi:hypothetical protein